MMPSPSETKSPPPEPLDGEFESGPPEPPPLESTGLPSASTSISSPSGPMTVIVGPFPVPTSELLGAGGASSLAEQAAAGTRERLRSRGMRVRMMAHHSRAEPPRQPSMQPRFG